MKVLSFFPKFKTEIQAEYAQRRAAHPHNVAQWGMLRSIMGDDAFFAAKAERQQWITENGYGPYYFDEQLDTDGNEIGRSYRFADPVQAVDFRMRF